MNYVCIAGQGNRPYSFVVFGDILKHSEYLIAPFFRLTIYQFQHIIRKGKEIVYRLAHAHNHPSSYSALVS